MGRVRAGRRFIIHAPPGVRPAPRAATAAGAGRLTGMRRAGMGPDMVPRQTNQETSPAGYNASKRSSAEADARSVAGRRSPAIALGPERKARPEEANRPKRGRPDRPSRVGPRFTKRRPGRVHLLSDCAHWCAVLYHFELQMAGVILLGAMLAGGIAMWYRRRRDALSESDVPDGIEDP